MNKNSINDKYHGFPLVPPLAWMQNLFMVLRHTAWRKLRMPGDYQIRYVGLYLGTPR